MQWVLATPTKAAKVTRVTDDEAREAFQRMRQATFNDLETGGPS